MVIGFTDFLSKHVGSPLDWSHVYIIKIHKSKESKCLNHWLHMDQFDGRLTSYYSGILLSQCQCIWSGPTLCFSYTKFYGGRCLTIDSFLVNFTIGCSKEKKDWWMKVGWAKWEVGRKVWASYLELKKKKKWKGTFWIIQFANSSWVMFGSGNFLDLNWIYTDILEIFFKTLQLLMTWEVLI